MSNFFTDLVEKLTRRQKKGKPVPVEVPADPKPEKIRQVPETIGTAVTYNRVDGAVSGGLFHAGNVTWDDQAKVYRVRNYQIQQEAARRAELDRQKRQKERGRREEEQCYASSTTFDDTFFLSSSETVYTAPESASGYDYPSPASSSSYVAPSPSYEAPPSYSSPSYSSDSGSSSSSSGYTSSYSDSGSSSSGGGYGGGE